MRRLKVFAAIEIKEIPLKLLILFDNFLGTGMMIAFFHCIGASSEWRTILNICRRCLMSWYPPCLRASVVTLWWNLGDWPVLMLLNVKSLLLILRSYSAVGISYVLRVVLVLRSSLKYSAHSSNNSENEDGGSPFHLCTEKAMFWSSLCSTFWLYWKVL